MKIIYCPAFTANLTRRRRQSVCDITVTALWRRSFSNLNVTHKYAMRQFIRLYIWNSKQNSSTIGGIIIELNITCNWYNTKWASSQILRYQWSCFGIDRVWLIWYTETDLPCQTYMLTLIWFQINGFSSIYKFVEKWKMPIIYA